MKQEGEKGADWLLWVSGPGSDLLLVAAEMCQLVDILKSKPLKNLSGLYVLPPRTIDAEPPRLSPAWGRTKKHRPGGVPATKGKANSVHEACREEEEGKGRAQAPRATDIHTRALPLLNWQFTAWHYAHPSIKVITTKTHSEWEALEEAQLLCADGHGPNGSATSVTTLTQGTQSSFPALKRLHLTEAIEFFLQGAPPTYRVVLRHYTGTARTTQRVLGGADMATDMEEMPPQTPTCFRLMPLCSHCPRGS